MNRLQKFVTEKYQDEELALELIRKYGLENILDNGIKKIENALKTEQHQSLPNYASIILSDSNNIIGTIQIIEDKRKIKSLLADIFKYYLDLCDFKDPSGSLTMGIISSLEKACELKEYDYNELQLLLNLDRYWIRSKNNSERNTQNHYQWNLKQGLLDIFLSRLKERNLIDSKKEFRRLFTKHDGSISIKLPENGINVLFLIIHQLGKEKIITPKGGNGLFVPIIKFCVDEQGNKIIKIPANKFHERLKRNEAEYDTLLQEARFFIKPISPSPDK